MITLLSFLAVIGLFNPTYSGNQVYDVGFTGVTSVSMTTGTPGATIFCTQSFGGYVNPTHSGGTPTGGTFIYSGPISTPIGSTYFRAIGYEAGMSDSNITSYTVSH